MDAPSNTRPRRSWASRSTARCHDHFFDPFAQKEFYAFRAIFEPEQIRTDRIPGIADIKKDGIPRIYDAQATAPTYLFHRGDERNPDKSKVIPPAVPAARWAARSRSSQ